MSIGRSILTRMFGCPTGLLGRLGGLILARANRRHAAWAIGLLDVQPHERALEIGFGPGVGIELLALQAHRVAGIDPSPKMLRQASRRNSAAPGDGRVDLRQAAAEGMPFASDSFDVALAVNSMQLWSNQAAALSEVRRVLREGGRLALAFTVHSGQPREPLSGALTAAGLHDCRIIDGDRAFCALATKG